MAEPILDKILSTLSAEDKVIVTSIVFTLVLSFIAPIFWSFDNPIVVPAPVIAIFLGISVSALLYRFLGGVNDATFAAGALKVTGTGAVLIAVSMWANEQLEKYVPKVGNGNTPFDISQHVTPKKEAWYATSRVNGLPVTLNFPVYGQTHEPPSYEEISKRLKERRIDLRDENGTVIAYTSNGNMSLELGQIQPSAINNVGYFDNYSVEFIHYRVVSFSSNKRVDVAAKLPFVVATKGFSENYTRFSLISRKNNSEIYEGAIYLRGREVVEVDGKYYLISVVQVNHAPDNAKPYAKIGVAEIIVKRA